MLSTRIRTSAGLRIVPLACCERRKESPEETYVQVNKVTAGNDVWHDNSGVYVMTSPKIGPQCVLVSIGVLQTSLRKPPSTAHPPPIG